MNIVKKIAVAAAFCAATVVSAQEGGISFGARLGYSLQSLDGGTLLASNVLMGTSTEVSMGMLGVGAGVVVNIPVGPVVVAPEVGFLYRTVANIENKDLFDPTVPVEKGTVTEFAVSVPIMVKYFPIEGLYVTAGLQLDIPIASEECDDKGKNCTKLDGKTEHIVETEIYYGTPVVNEYDEKHPERNSLDIGIPMGVGYMVTPNLGVDFRFVLGLSNGVKFDTGIPIIGTLESGSMNTFGLGVTYLF